MPSVSRPTEFNQNALPGKKSFIAALVLALVVDSLLVWEVVATLVLSENDSLDLIVFVFAWPLEGLLALISLGLYIPALRRKKKATLRPLAWACSIIVVAMPLLAFVARPVADDVRDNQDVCQILHITASWCVPYHQRMLKEEQRSHNTSYANTHIKAFAPTYAPSGFQARQPLYINDDVSVLFDADADHYYLFRSANDSSYVTSTMKATPVRTVGKTPWGTVITNYQKVVYEDATGKYIQDFFVTQHDSTYLTLELGGEPSHPMTLSDSAVLDIFNSVKSIN